MGDRRGSRDVLIGQEHGLRKPVVPLGEVGQKRFQGRMIVQELRTDTHGTSAGGVPLGIAVPADDLLDPGTPGPEEASLPVAFLARIPFVLLLQDEGLAARMLADEEAGRGPPAAGGNADGTAVAVENLCR